MFVVGITGGIATGKSIVADYLKNHGAIVIDADKIARIVIKEPDVFNSLVENFGEEILKDHEIDRRILGRMVFGDKEKLNQLNEIMLPNIVKMILEDLHLFSKTAPPNQIVVIDAPLLIESELHKQTDMIVLVKSKETLRLERLVNKGFTDEEAKDRISVQLSEEEKQKYADYIVLNNGSLEELNKKAVDLCRKIVHLASF